MFDTLKYPEQQRCKKGDTHKFHEWRTGFLWLFPRWCPGIPPLRQRTEEEAWLAANPSLGHCVSINSLRRSMELKPHKHYYLLKNNILVTPAGMPVSRDNVYWQCASPWCLDIVSMNREHVREHLTRKPIYQSWPG